MSKKTKKTRTKSAQRAQRAKAQAMRLDRTFFNEHPKIYFYRREAIPGEFDPKVVPAGERVSVVRTSSPYLRFCLCGGVVTIDIDGPALGMLEALPVPPSVSSITMLRSDLDVWDGDCHIADDEFDV